MSCLQHTHKLQSSKVVRDLHGCARVRVDSPNRLLCLVAGVHGKLCEVANASAGLQVEGWLQDPRSREGRVRLSTLSGCLHLVQDILHLMFAGVDGSNPVSGMAALHKEKRKQVA